MTFRRSAQLWARTGDFRRSAEAKLKAGEPMMAAELFERCGDFAQAGEIYEQHGDHVRASSLFEKAGDKRRAADLLYRALVEEGPRQVLGQEKVEVCRRVGALYAECGLMEHAVRVLVWGGQSLYAGRLLARAGHHQAAIELLSQSGDFLAAAEIARSIGNEALAHKLLGGRAEQEGRLLEAAAHYDEAGLYPKAARLYELAGDPRRSAEAHERAGQFDVAAQIYERLGEIEQAARCLRAAGRSTEGDMLMQRLEVQKDAIRSYVEAGDFLNAAVGLLAMARGGEPTLYADAVNYLEQVHSEHRDYVTARTLLAEVLAERGDNRRALNTLLQLLGGVTPSREHLPALYQYGRLLELDGLLAGARTAYQTAAAFDPSYRDLRERLRYLSETSGEQSGIRNVPVAPMVVGAPRHGSAPYGRPIPFFDTSPSNIREISNIDASQEKSGIQQAPILPPPDSLSAAMSAAADLELPELPKPLPAPNGASDLVLQPLESVLHSDVSSATMELIDDQLREISDIDGTTPVELEEPPPPPSPETKGDADASIKIPKPKAPPKLETAESLVGVVLRGRFRIEKKIGRGAQAQVYLARDQVLDREVAIKVLNDSVTEDEAALERFLREARLAARVHHSGCIAIFDFGEERGLTFMAMEYFKGRTLRELLKRGPLQSYLALRIARDVASALGAVHDAGIVHRDVKPTNVMVDRSGRVRLTDFGVASNLGDNSSSGMMVGTMKYMAPEQARGKEADRRADIFSLGVVLFEMLTGQAPFGGTLDALIKRVTKAPPPLPDDVDVPKVVRDLVKKCMLKRPASRYASTDALIEDLTKAVNQLKAKRKRNKAGGSKGGGGQDGEATTDRRAALSEPKTEDLVGEVEDPEDEAKQLPPPLPDPEHEDEAAP